MNEKRKERSIISSSSSSSSKEQQQQQKDEGNGFYLQVTFGFVRNEESEEVLSTTEKRLDSAQFYHPSLEILGIESHKIYKKDKCHEDSESPFFSLSEEKEVHIFFDIDEGKWPIDKHVNSISIRNVKHVISSYSFDDKTNVTHLARGATINEYSHWLPKKKSDHRKRLVRAFYEVLKRVPSKVEFICVNDFVREAIFSVNETDLNKALKSTKQLF